jgi:transposase
MPWPPGSPDMNIIEHVWAILKSKIKKRRPQPSNLDQLWVAAQEEWYSIPKDQIDILYRSIPDRIAALLDAKGWYTKY